MPRILILEDDFSKSEWLKERIQSLRLSLSPKVDTLDNESEFLLQWLPAFEKRQKEAPVVILVDLTLRWTNPSPNPPPRPPEVIEGTFANAGLRCVQLIQQNAGLCRSRVILYTTTNSAVESLGKIPSAVEFLPNGDLPEILSRVRAALETLDHTM